jgi:hypothetical protein
MHTTMPVEEARRRLIELLSEDGHQRQDEGECTLMTRGERRYRIGPTTVTAQFFRRTHRLWANEKHPIRSITEVLGQLERQRAAAQRAAKLEEAATMDSAIARWTEAALSELQNAITDARMRAKATERPEDQATVEALEAAQQALRAARDSIRPAAEDEEA